MTNNTIIIATFYSTTFGEYGMYGDSFEGVTSFLTLPLPDVFKSKKEAEEYLKRIGFEDQYGGWVGKAEALERDDFEYAKAMIVEIISYDEEEVVFSDMMSYNF